MNHKLRILVVDDDHNMAKTLTDVLRVKGHEAQVAHSGAQALEKAAQGELDCVLSDVKMPGMDGVELHRALKARQPDLPVVLMTAYSSDSLVNQGLEQGAIAALTKPLDLGLLLAFFSFLRQERSIAIVDDDPNFCKTLGDLLRARGFAVTTITDPHGVLERLGTDKGVVLLDMKMNSVGGLEVLREIREQYPHLPVILVTGHRQEMAPEIEAALEIGAYTCLYKPVEMERLFELLTQIRRRELSKILKT